MDIDRSQRWYLAQLKPNGFEKAVVNLARQQFETFMPMQMRTVRQARKLTNVLRPVFSGYIFIRFGLDGGDWRKINSTQGVAHLVSFNKSTPAPVPEALIEALKQRCDEAQLLQPHADLTSGDTVKFGQGAFAEFSGTIEKMLDGERVRILFDFMGQETRVDLDAAAVERIDSKGAPE